MESWSDGVVPVWKEAYFVYFAVIPLLWFWLCQVRNSDFGSFGLWVSDFAIGNSRKLR